MTISVIIPAYNEEKQIATTLLALQPLRQQGNEIILVDAGSDDDTVKCAKPLVDKVIRSEKGRARQMNRGAEKASGEILWFLHADTLVSDSALVVLSETMNLPGFNWARFNVRLSGKHFLFRIIEKLINLRSCITGIATGDQGLCLRKELFEQIGRFPDLSLMEDVALSKKLRAISRPLCISESIVTSSRRWEENGIISTVLLMWKLRFLYWLGVSADKLARQYK